MSTDSSPMPKSNKRDRLVQVATDLFHRQGYENVSLSDVARESGVLQGNIYYYFKTKRLLAIAVLETWQNQVATALTALEEKHDPRERIITFLETANSFGEMYTAWGCPIANLSHALLSESGENLDPAPCVYQVHLTWLKRQFEAIDHPAKEAELQSQQLLSALQGGIHLAHVMGSKELLERLLMNYCDRIRAL
jgi:TetR/AcrR family transcriptional regulator, transcriptional repressor for nem operon